jgi:hypothetical protein
MESFKVIDIGPIGYSPMSNTWIITITLEKGKKRIKLFLTSELATEFANKIKETMILKGE